MQLKPNASAAWAAQFIPVTAEQYSISSPPLSPSHWHCHKLTVQSICACNDLCKSKPSMCTQKKVPACLQQLFSVKSGHKMTTNWSPLVLPIGPAEAVVTPPQPPFLLGTPHACAAEHTLQAQMSLRKSLRVLRRIEQHSVGHYQTIQTDTNEVLTRPQEQANTTWTTWHLPGTWGCTPTPYLITLVVEVKAFEIQFFIIFSMLA